MDAYVRQLVEKAVAGVNGGQKEPSLEERFQTLVARWRKEVAPFSSVTRITQHPAYQEIIALGQDVIPLILRDLERQPDHWFAALQALTRANPVPPGANGNMEQLAAAWLRWGKEHGFT